MKVEPIAFADGLDLGLREKEESKMMPRSLVYANGGIELH